MNESQNEDAALRFAPLRPKLIRVAYRMLGSVAEAEDVVQDAFLRWLATDRNSIREPAAFLQRVVVRLCLDQLKSARSRRETYIGPWLPEPVVEADDDEVDDITLPLMMVLERLSPLERAAFLLHDVSASGSRRLAKQSVERPKHAASLRVAHALMSMRRGRDFRSKRNKDFKSQPPFSRRRAAETCSNCGRCWRPM